MVLAAVIALNLARQLLLKASARAQSGGETTHDDLEGDDLHYRAAAAGRLSGLLAALNDRGSEGVTPENNAAVLSFKAMGPGMVQRQFRDRVLQDARHRAAAGRRAQYFVPFDKFVKASSPPPGRRRDEKSGSSTIRP